MVTNTKITLHIDKALISRVDTVAKRLGCSRAEIINKALIDCLENVEDLEIARQRMANQKDAVISLEDAKTQL